MRGLALGAAVFVIAVTCDGPAIGETHYNVQIELPQSTADSLRVVLDLTSSNAASNEVMLTDLNHDCRARKPEGLGGPITGEVLSAPAPGDTVVLKDGYFLNQVALAFDLLGSFIRLKVGMSESTGASNAAPDAVAFYLIEAYSDVAIGSAEPYGTNALFGITVTGAAGGELEVFAPMSFIPPDTLRLGVDLNLLVRVAVGSGFSASLRTQHGQRCI